MAGGQIIVYTVKYNNQYIHLPSSHDLNLLEPKLELEKNMSGQFSFGMLENHPQFGEIKPLEFELEIFDDDTLIYKGRMIDEVIDLDRVHSYTFGGKLSALNDSIHRASKFEGSPDDLFAQLIENHNNQVSDSQKFIVGSITVTDPNDYINRSWENAEDTWELMTSRLLEPLGGYLVLRYEEDGDYIDWLEGFDIYANQKAELGSNLLDFSQQLDMTETFTACIPYGAEVEHVEYALVEYGGEEEEPPEWEENTYYQKSGDTYVLIESESVFNSLISGNSDIYTVSSTETTGERVTVAEVNNGDDFLINETMAEKYGIIYAPMDLVTWDDVHIPSILKIKALDLLNNTGVMTTERVSLSFLDLSLAGYDVGNVRLYHKIRAISDKEGTQSTYLVEKMSLDLSNPENLVIEVGTEGLRLSDKINKAEKDNSNNKDKIEEIKKDYATNDKLESEILKTATQILQTAEEIILGMTSEVLTSADLEDLREEITNLLTISEEGFNFEFSQLSETLTNLGLEVSEQKQYIRLEQGNIIIGKEGNPVVATFTNDSLAFAFNGEPVATFTNEQLWARNVAVDNQVSFFGNWAIRQGNYKAGKGHNLNDMWIG